MPSGFETYHLYLAVKAHFTRKTYDFHKFKGKVNAGVEAYERRSDRYFFEKLGKKYNREKIVDLFVANFVTNPSMWIGELLDDQAEEVYLQWLGTIEKLTYHFTEECDGILNWLETNGYKFNDLFRVKGSDHPIIVKMALQKVVSLETFVALEKMLGFVKRINKQLDDPIWQNLHTKVVKYSPFLNIDVGRFKKILRHKIDSEYPSLV